MNQSSAVSQEGKTPHLDLMAALPRLGLGEAHRRDLRAGEGAPGDQFLLHGVDTVASDILDRGHALVGSRVGKEEPSSDVTDRPHPWSAGSHPLVDADEASLVQFDTCRLQPDAPAIGPTADR